MNFDEEDVRQKINGMQIPPEHIRYIGFPVRPEFLRPGKAVQKLKQEFAIPEERKVVMVLMGSAGSRATLRYAYAFSKLKLATPVHLILCLGRNEALRAAVESITFPADVSVTIMGFTDRIADLMRMSDLVITKSGPTSICEAVSLGIPVIVDRTQRALWWEIINIDFVTKHGFGDALCGMRKFPKLIKRYIEDDAYTEKIRENIRNFAFPDAAERVHAVIDEMIAMNDHPVAQTPDLYDLK